MNTEMKGTKVLVKKLEQDLVQAKVGISEQYSTKEASHPAIDQSLTLTSSRTSSRSSQSSLRKSSNARRRL